MALELIPSVGIWLLALAVAATIYQVSAAADDVAHAAAEAARAASMTSTPADATRVANTMAAARLVTGSCEPGSVDVDADTTRFGAGGTVQITVSCRTDPLIGSPRRLSATAEEAIDRFRGGL